MSDAATCVRVTFGNGFDWRPFSLPGLFGRIWSRPAGASRGGDLHALSACTHANLSRLIVADAAGHGEAATAAADRILDAMRELHHVIDNVKVLRRLNACLPSPGLATAVSTTLDAKTGELYYAYAGIPGAIHYRRSARKWSSLEAVCSVEHGPVGLPLGVIEEGVYCQTRTRLEMGDLLLLTTDGLLDVPSPEGERPGLEGLLELCAALDDPHPIDVAEAIRDGLSGWAGRDDGTLPDHDDLTLIVAERTSSLESEGVE